MTWQYFHLCGCCCSRPAALLKLDIRYKTLITYQTFDCIVKVKAEFMNKSKEYYNDNEDIAVMMFDINYGYRRWMEMMMRKRVLSPCLCFLPPNKGRLRWISSPTASQMTFSVPTLDFHKMDSFSQGFMSLEICQISHSHTPAGIISFRTSQSRNFF